MPNLPPPEIMLFDIGLLPMVAFSPLIPRPLSPVPISKVLLDIVTADAVHPSCNSMPQQLLLITVLPEVLILVLKPFQITTPLAEPPLFRNHTIGNGNIVYGTIGMKPDAVGLLSMATLVTVKSSLPPTP